MLAILALAVCALALARVAGWPGAWRPVVAGVAVLVAGSQLLPPGHAMRVDLAGWARSLLWGAVALAPILAYGLFVRRLRRQARPAASSPAAGHPVGLVWIVADADLAAETRAALDAEAVGDRAALSLAWRTPDETLAGHLRMRQTGETMEIELLWVDPAHRRQGIAARLLAAAEGEARRRGARRMAVILGSWQPGAVLARAGFVAVAERPLGPGSRRIWLEKELR